MHVTIFASLLVAIFAVSQVAAFVEDGDAMAISLFKGFMGNHKKQYATREEFNYRLSVFKGNMEVAKKLQKLNPAGSYGVTKFSDLTPDEFKKFHLMPSFSHEDIEGEAGPLNKANLNMRQLQDPLPQSFDWRGKGAVTAVRDQGRCNSDWAITVTEAIESAWYLAGNPLTNLSVSQIVDCDSLSDECRGGAPQLAYRYVINAGGLESEEQTKRLQVVASIKSYLYATTSHNETEMQMVLYNQGPLSVCVSSTDWQHYQRGVMTYCYGIMDHCAQATGFTNVQGSDNVTYPVWTIRNSWGTDWGVDGYLYLERNKDLCGVADLATIPVVDKNTVV
ncbi:Cysteine protease1 [Balamuthia mandrillaris]